MNVKELVKGDKVALTSVPYISKYPRLATIVEKARDNIIVVKIDESFGYFGDIGSVYIDEVIVKFKNDDWSGIEDQIKLDDKQQEAMASIRQSLKDMGMS